MSYKISETIHVSYTDHGYRLVGSGNNAHVEEYTGTHGMQIAVMQFLGSWRLEALAPTHAQSEVAQ